VAKCLAKGLVQIAWERGLNITQHFAERMAELVKMPHEIKKCTRRILGAAAKKHSVSRKAQSTYPCLKIICVLRTDGTTLLLA